MPGWERRGEGVSLSAKTPLDKVTGNREQKHRILVQCNCLNGNVR